jgi:DNA polymerase-3 subunit beta
MTAQTIETAQPTVSASLELHTDRETLLSALTFVNANAVSNRPPVPVLAGIALRPGSVTAFDYETAAIANLPIDGNGVALAAGKPFVEMVKSLDKRARVTVTAQASSVTREQTEREWDTDTSAYREVKVMRTETESTITLQSGPVTFDVPTLVSEDLPELPDYSTAAHAFTVNADTLQAAAARALITAGQNDTLPVLTAVNVEIGADGVTLATTDRYRLGVGTLAPIVRGDDRVFNVNAAGMVKACKALSGNVSVRVTDGFVVLSDGTRTVVTRLQDGEFPRYRALIPSDFTSHIDVTAADLTRAVKRMSVALDKNAPVKLDASFARLEVQAVKSRETVPATLTGDPVVIGFNPSYLLDALAAVGADTVGFDISASRQPAIVRDRSDATYLCLIMPVKLGE